MIYKQQSYLPIIFQVDEGIIYNVDEFLRRNKLAFTNVLVVSGKSLSIEYADKIAAKNNWKRYILGGNTFEEVEKLKNYVNSENIDLIIGVGGGKTIDSVKRVGYLTNVNPLAIPTIISNDGLISPVSVIENSQGKTESLPGMMPLGVLIDIDVIKNSPHEFIRAAAGDLLSNISSTNDWILAFQRDKESMNDIAFHQAKSAAKALIHFKDIDLYDKQFLRLLVQGLVNSGIAMALAGSSRPCSGSEHLISHALDYLDLSEELHGIQVGSISLFTLFLQNKLRKEYIDFCKTVGLPLDFTTFVKGFSDSVFKEILQKSREMRPTRFTVLSLMTDAEIMEKYGEFKAALRESQ